MLEEQLGDRQLAVSTRGVKRSPAVSGGLARVGAVLDQQLRYRGRSVAR